MSKPAYDILFGEKSLTKKELNFLRKLTTINGRKIIKEISLNPDHKFRELFLSVWHEFTCKETHGINKKRFWEAMCKEPVYTYDDYWLERGQQQKRTYRTNRFDESMSYARTSMSQGNWRHVRLLWKINSDLNQNSESGRIRIPTISNYITANNAEEAQQLWETMVLQPLGLNNDRRWGYHARLVGVAKYFSPITLNSQSINEAKEVMKQEQRELEAALALSKEKVSKAEFAFAMINQTLMMISQDELQ